MDYSNNVFFENLVKPEIQPPDWIFTPVWSALYFLMFISFVMILDKKNKLKPMAFTFFFLQLAVNLCWPYVFFGLNNIEFALYILFSLVILSIICAILFFKIFKPSGLLFIPYILWLFFALYLNAQIVNLNT